MSPDDVKEARRAIGVTQKDLAELLQVEVQLVRDWEKGERFPTKAHCEQMDALRANPPPKKKKGNKSPMQLLGDPTFFALVRKLLTHAALRAEAEKLAAGYADPLDEE